MATRAKLSVILIAALALSACVKSALAPTKNSIPVPNGDFESWTTNDELKQWKTNSCPACVPAYNTYIVQKTIEAYHGQYAAKLLYNGVFSATANTKFGVPAHPFELVSYVKCQLYENDTAFIRVNVFKAGALVDSGVWMSTVPINKYAKITVPITQSTAEADSVSISIRGGHAITDEGNSSTLWVDSFCLH